MAPRTINKNLWLTLEQRAIICEYDADARAKGKRLQLTDLAQWAASKFKLDRPPSLATISRLRSNAEAFQNQDRPRPRCKIMPSAAVNALDAKVRRVFDEMDGKRDINGEMIKAIGRKELEGSDTQDRALKFTNGWLYKFQRRQGISLKRKHGESGSVKAEEVEAARVKMRKLTDKYARCDIYNMDETAYFYQAEASSTLTAQTSASGRKETKKRVTLALTTNADGSDKLPPLIIGSAMCPIPLRGHLKDNRVEESDVDYTNSKKGWMNSEIFMWWLRNLDERMRERGRHILLLVDNVSSHKRPIETLTNVTLEFLPKNQTCKVQPNDQGVFANFKSIVRAIKAMKVVDDFYKHGAILDEEIDILTAIRWARQAWDSITPETIRNCWRHAGILSDRFKLGSILTPVELPPLSSLLYTV